MENENKHTYDNGFHPKAVKLKPNYKFYNNNFIFRIFSLILSIITKIWIIIPKIYFSYKVIGRKNAKKIKGAVIISNHIHPLDAFLLVSSFYFRKIYVTMLQSNLGFGLVSKYMRIAAAVPIPTDRRLIRKFNEETKATLEKGKNILFYPEAALIPYCDHIRNFLPGAFHYAVVNNRPIIPCCFTFHKPKGIYKLFKKNKPVIHLNILEPYFIKEFTNRNEAIKNTTKEINELLSNYFKENSDYYF